jgi:hypothetical protein
MIFLIKFDERYDSGGIFCMLSFFQFRTNKLRESFKHSTTICMRAYQIFDILSIYIYTISLYMM